MSKLTEIKAWIATQPTRDTSELRRLVHVKPEVSRTPQADLQVEREAYSYEVAIRAVVVARYGPLSQYAGLSVKERFMLLRTNLKAAYDAASDQTGRNQAMYDAQDIKGLNDQAKEVSGGMSHASFLDQYNAVPRPDIVVYGQSPAEANSWGTVTGDDIEAAMRL